MEILYGLFIPFLGTAAGAAGVYVLKENPKENTQKILSGFAAGVMTAASVWSLLIPAMEQSESLESLAFLPAFAGFWAGTLFLLAIDHFTPHLHIGSRDPEGIHSGLSDTALMLLAVTIHNIPEGMAVGVLYAGFASGSGISLAAAMALSLGIAIQNFPEGAIVSMPLYAEGNSKHKAFLQGVLSGAVEPAAGFLTILLAEQIVPFMPYLLSFAAGAMMYVVVEELIPEMAQGEHSNIGTIAFAAGFTVMMALDVALG